MGLGEGTRQMTIEALEWAISGRANVCAIVVSEVLFFRLDAADKIKIVQVTPDLSHLMLGDGRIRRFLRSIFQKTQQPVMFTYFALETGHRKIRVELSALWEFSLTAEGPGSFMLLA
jgi:hypothetical protein